MAVHYAWYSLVYIIILFSAISETARNRRIEVTSINPVFVGGILVVQCRVWNIRTSDKVNFFHYVNGQPEQITLDNHYAETSIGDRSYLAKRTFTDGSRIFFLTVVDIKQSDEGKYVCKVYSWSDITDIEEDSFDIRMHSFPNKVYPVCQSTPSIDSVTIGDRLLLKCTSERTFPLVTLTWSSSSDSSIVHNTRNTTSYSVVSFETSLVLQQSHNGAVFVCTMTSPGFPQRERSCIIGPLNIIHESRNGVLDANPVAGVEQSKHGSSIKGDVCNSSCTTGDKFTLLYWAVALVSTTILMLIFLTTTIIWCCKYHAISNEVTPPVERRSVTYTSGDVVDPVYVSLQRRTEHDRSSTYSTYVTRPEPDRSSTYSSYSSYMTVEDPSNSGNKVIMPKEVFDEFYRSLSLKKNREPKPEPTDVVIPLRM